MDSSSCSASKRATSLGSWPRDSASGVVAGDVVACSPVWAGLAARLRRRSGGPLRLSSAIGLLRWFGALGAIAEPPSHAWEAWSGGLDRSRVRRLPVNHDAPAAEQRGSLRAIVLSHL